MTGSKKRSVLIVCHANVSRSVMAEAILQKLLEERRVENRFTLDSGGVAYYARDGALASLDARLALEDIGIHVSPDTVSKDLKRQRHLVEAADIILAMTTEQVAMIAEGFPEAEGTPVYTLKQYAGTAGDIEDPQGKDESVFQACRNEIHACCVRAVERLIAGDGY